MKGSHANSNKQIYEELSKIVIGHEHAKKVLINLVNRSKLAYYQKWGLLETEHPITLSNCLLIGDSGTGKTFLVESLSSVMEFPLVKIDATELNPTGASGGLKKKDVVKKIIDKVKEVMEESPETYWSLDGTLDQVIVFVDEIDKLGQQLSSDWNAHVQSNFLTLFENKGELKGITFVFAGAFTGLEKRGSKKESIGFSRQEEKEHKSEDLAQKVIKFGLIPELVGRLHNIVLLDELKEGEYRHILIHKLLPKAREHLSYFGIEDFDLTVEQIHTLVNSAMKSGLGVRALETGLNKLLVEIEFNPESYIGVL